jgi:hypothetical protein
MVPVVGKIKSAIQYIGILIVIVVVQVVQEVVHASLASVVGKIGIHVLIVSLPIGIQIVIVVVLVVLAEEVIVLGVPVLNNQHVQDVDVSNKALISHVIVIEI